MEMYTVVWMEEPSWKGNYHRTGKSERLASSAANAMKLESAEFGWPCYRIIRAYKTAPEGA